MSSIPRVLSIAGSDSGGGAGIEADLKTCTALGVHGMAAVTAITAQNTVGVFGVRDVPPDLVAQQIDVVAEDIGVDAAKTGMLSSSAIIEAVAESLTRNMIRNLVVDPVMIAKSGDALLQDEARSALKDLLLPAALVVTPNIPEAEVLSGLVIASEEAVVAAAEKIIELGPRYVLMKGGHLEGPEACDYLFDGENVDTFRSPRIDTPNTHGTGCTYSAAIAAYIARGLDVPESVERAKAYLTRAIETSLPLGNGHGPLNHGWPLESPD